MNLDSLLLVDAGNTRVKWASTPIGPFQELEVAGEVATTEANAEFFRSLAARYRQHYLVLASVVPRLVPLVGQPFKRRFHAVDADSAGLKYDYPKPAEVGADRLAAAVAIVAEKLHPAIVVAAGTATAFTVIDSKGRFCGGAIAPGLEAQLAALINSTAQLRMTDLRQPRKPIGKSTADAIRFGVIAGFQGGVKEIIAQLAGATAGGKTKLVLTGGNAEMVARNLGLRYRLRPLLVLEGLRIIGNRIWNSESK